MISQASSLIQESQALITLLDKVSHKVKAFAGDTEKKAKNIVRGLEQKVQDIVKKQEDLGETANGKCNEKDLLVFQEAQSKNIDHLKSQLATLRNYLDTVDKFQATKISLNIELDFQLTPMPVHGLLNKYDHLIC